MNATKQVVIVVADILYCIQYHIHSATICNFFATNLHVKFPHTFQCGEQNANVAFHPFVDE